MVVTVAIEDVPEETKEEEEPVEDAHFRMPDKVAVMTGVSLGFGTFTDVVEVSYRGRLYAAKVYRHVESEMLIASLYRERQILSMIQHKNIIPYYGTYQLEGGETTAIIMQRMDKNLRLLLDQITLQHQQKISILNDIAQGLAFLHSQKPSIVHRDLNATNVLLDTKMTAKLADFGNTVLIDRETPILLTPFPGTAEYMPPEAASGEYDEKLDIFSFGHLSVYILGQQQPSPLLPYTYVDNETVCGRSEVERRREYLDNVRGILDTEDESQLYSVIINCLQNEPKLRPSAEEIINSGVFVMD